MDAEIDVILGLIVGTVVVWATAIIGSIDALGQPGEAWERAGFRRLTWLWQAMGVFVPLAAVVYSGVYFVHVRPRLIAAARELAFQRSAWITAPVPSLNAASPVDEIRMRAPLWVASPALPSLVLFTLDIHLAPAGSLVKDAGVLWAAIGLLLLTSSAAFGVTLTPYDVVIRGFIRRHVAWSDVVAITQESILGSRYVRLWTRSGASHRLRAPITQLGIGRRRFDANFAVLQHWWLTHLPATDRG